MKTDAQPELPRMRGMWEEKLLVIADQPLDTGHWYFVRRASGQVACAMAGDSAYPRQASHFFRYPSEHFLKSGGLATEMPKGLPVYFDPDTQTVALEGANLIGHADDDSPARAQVWVSVLFDVSPSAVPIAAHEVSPATWVEAVLSETVTPIIPGDLPVPPQGLKWAIRNAMEVMSPVAENMAIPTIQLSMLPPTPTESDGGADLYRKIFEVVRDSLTPSDLYGALIRTVPHIFDPDLARRWQQKDLLKFEFSASDS